MEYIIHGSLLSLMIVSLVAVKVGLANRPTYDDMKEKAEELQRKDLCEEIRMSINEKLDLIPKMERTLIKMAAKMGVTDD